MCNNVIIIFRNSICFDPICRLRNAHIEHKYSIIIVLIRMEAFRMAASICVILKAKKWNTVFLASIKMNKIVNGIARPRPCTSKHPFMPSHNRMLEHCAMCINYWNSRRRKNPLHHAILMRIFPLIFESKIKIRCSKDPRAHVAAEPIFSRF